MSGSDRPLCLRLQVSMWFYRITKAGAYLYMDLDIFEGARGASKRRKPIIARLVPPARSLMRRFKTSQVNSSHSSLCYDRYV